VPAREFVEHTYRFHQLRTDGGVLGEYVEIPEGPDNLLRDGSLRRHEKGSKLELDRVRAAGVDPAKVLFYRVTQPRETPAPEYYWTSDSNEVRRGLTHELGTSAQTAIVLAASLETIAQNGGLIEDVNEDEGLPLRQIGLGPFDQNEALFSFNRVHDPKSVGAPGTRQLVEVNPVSG
jgi:hypothetical protein